jgi:DUF4097 and DUF4098 domain-containing protein YvlB
MKLTPATMRFAVPFLALLIPAFGQFQENTEAKLACDSRSGDRRHERSCEVRETRLPVTQRLEVLAAPNGGVSIRGWNRQEIWVRARVEAQAPSEGEAKALAGQVHVQSGAGRVSANGPERLRDAWWSVSYEVFVPHRIDLKASSVNGGVNISDVEGDIAYSTVNGGVNLSRLAGNVRGETKNGGVNVEMAGDRWQGAGLDAQTHNGGVNLQLPVNYSARIMASTVNGGLRTEFPVTLSGDLERRPKNLEFNVGSGGAPIRIVTHNGGVNIKKKAI